MAFCYSCYIHFNRLFLFCRNTGDARPALLDCGLSGIWFRRLYLLFKLTNNTTFLDDVPFSLFQKISFHRVGAYIYFTIQGIDCKAVSMLFPFRRLRPRITVKAISYPLAGIPQHWHCLASRNIFLYSVSGRNVPYNPMRKILNWM